MGHGYQVFLKFAYENTTRDQKPPGSHPVPFDGSDLNQFGNLPSFRTESGLWDSVQTFYMTEFWNFGFSLVLCSAQLEIKLSNP